MDIEEGKDYKYKEICAIRGERVKTGKSRQLQINNWRRFYDWENPKKQTYRITKVRAVPFEKSDKRCNNGGYREGAGAKVKVQDEFDFLFNTLIHRDFNRNACGGKAANLCTTYFTNKEISLHFGFFNEYFYSDTRVNDKRVNEDAFREIGAKIREKLNSWVYKKIEKLENVEFTYGIIAYNGQGTKRNFEYQDEWLDDWNKYQEEYLKRKGYSGLYKVFDNNEYMEMVNYISTYFEGYTTVLKCRKVNFDIKLLVPYDWELYPKYVKSLNEKLVDELRRYFSKEKNDSSAYNYIIEKYVKI